MTATITITERDRDALVEGLLDTIVCLQNAKELALGGFCKTDRDIDEEIRARESLIDFLEGLEFREE